VLQGYPVRVGAMLKSDIYEMKELVVGYFWKKGKGEFKEGVGNEYKIFLSFASLFSSGG
jgi:hypothetical protein